MRGAGRVDQAIEFPLPDAGARARLVELFCRDFDADLSRLDVLVAETDGVSPAFLRELVHKAALYAAMGVEPAICQAQCADAFARARRRAASSRAASSARATVLRPRPQRVHPGRSDCS